MNKSTILRAAVTLAAAAAAMFLVAQTRGVDQPADSSQAARFDADGRLLQPEGYRQWFFVGAVVTPNDMNEPKAAFPEFHHVYIDPAGYEHFKTTGEFRDGTMLVKELASVGSKKASSGNGYFPGELQGLDVALKSKQHHPKEPGNWGYYTFGHAPPPYEKTAAVMATDKCANCHKATAEIDMVFTQYYPVLTAERKLHQGQSKEK